MTSADVVLPAGYDQTLKTLKNRVREARLRTLRTVNTELIQGKDPYAFEFLGLSGEVAERDLEQALTDRIVDTLRELGPGFAFVGRQVHFDVGGDDFYIDLLFFHVDQLRYFVIELKTGKFQPEYAGKLNFYVALVDDQLKPAHNDTVGILICGSKNEHTVRYALGRSDSPMAISTYTYESLPPAEQDALPGAEELSAAFDQSTHQPIRANDAHS